MVSGRSSSFTQTLVGTSHPPRTFISSAPLPSWCMCRWGVVHITWVFCSQHRRWRWAVYQKSDTGTAVKHTARLNHLIINVGTVIVHLENNVMNSHVHLWSFVSVTEDLRGFGPEVELKVKKKINPAAETQILSGSLLFNYTTSPLSLSLCSPSTSLFFFFSPEQFVIFSLHIHTPMFLSQWNLLVLIPLPSHLINVSWMMHFTRFCLHSSKKSFVCHRRRVLKSKDGRWLLLPPVLRYLLVTAGEDRLIKTWDLRRLDGPIILLKRYVTNEIHWTLNTPGVLMAQETSYVA